MTEQKSKVNKVYKFVSDLVTYETVVVGTAVVATVTVGVFGLTPLTLLGAVLAPFAAGVAAFAYKL